MHIRMSSVSRSVIAGMLRTQRHAALTAVRRSTQGFELHKIISEHREGGASQRYRWRGRFQRISLCPRRSGTSVEGIILMLCTSAERVSEDSDNAAQDQIDFTAQTDGQCLVIVCFRLLLALQGVLES